MKKILIITLTVLLTHFCLAQRQYKHLYPGYFGSGISNEPTGFRIGIKAGASQTDITRQLLLNPNLEDKYEPTFNPSAGLFLQYGLSPQFLVNTGLEYVPMAINYKTTSSSERTLTQIKRNYLQIPFLLQGTLRKGAYKPYPAIYGGAAVALLFDAKRDFERVSLNENQEIFNELDVDVSQDFSTVDYGLIAGLAYYIPFHNQYQIMIDLRGYLGLANINNLAEGAVDRPFTVNQTISISIGLLWGR